MLPTLLHPVLMQRPLGLVFDIDGTLSPIAPTPETARLYPGVATLLAQARDHPDVHVAIITGRGIERGAALVNVDGLTYIGTHGLEWSDGLPAQSSIQVTAEALRYQEPATALLDLAEQHFSTREGVFVERKRIGGSIHYRLSAQPEEVRQQILTLLEEPARYAGLTLSEGKRIVEVKASLPIDKGVALHIFAERFHVRGLLFAGDDRTDLDAVKKTAYLRQQGIAALAIAVKYADTLPELLENADIIVDGVEGMVTLLREIVAAL